MNPEQELEMIIESLQAALDQEIDKFEVADDYADLWGEEGVVYINPSMLN
jgi:hypothetical protein